MVCLTGCWNHESINVEYGKRHGTSVNGTGVLAGMFQQAGHSVSTWRRFSPKLDSEQVIVWAPDDFKCPSVDHVAYLSSWLAKEEGRTLIYIGRDYDASIDYWRQMLDNASGDKALELRLRLAKARSLVMLAGGEDESSRKCDWFRFEHRTSDRITGPLSGSWSEGFTDRAFTAHLAARLVLREPPESEEGESYDELRIEPLITIGGEPFAVRLTRGRWRSSRVIVVANGSTFLNFPLVQHRNRSLAVRLIDECGQLPQRVTFLESDRNGPLISDSDKSPPIMLRAFTVWPINFLLLHFTILGIFFCFAVFPIFGRPRTLDRDEISDFGKHVAAVGDLLQSTGNETYAQKLVEQYRVSKENA
jgi:hypothetical protein